MSAMPPEHIAAEIKEALYQGNKIEAIRLFRNHSDKGLAEAKEFIEGLAEELYAAEPERFASPPSASGKGCSAVFLAGILLLTAAVGFALA